MTMFMYICTLCFLCSVYCIKGEYVDLPVYPPILAKQRLLKTFLAATMNYWRLCFLYGLYLMNGE
jgi:hypothetical protein